MINPDNSGIQLAQQGFGQIDQLREKARQERMMRMPVPQAYADYIQRLLSDPNVDPAQLGREAAQHPEIAQYLQGGGQPQGQPMPRPQDSLSQVGPGAGPGSPALYPPGGVNPAHGPGAMPQPGPPFYGKFGGVPPTVAEANAARRGGALSAWAQPGIGYDQPPPQYQPVPMQASLGNQLQGNPGQHAQSAAAIAPSQPQPQYVQSLGQAGQPMQGPQVSPQEAGAQGSRPVPQQPGGGPLVPRMDPGPPKFQGGDTMSYRDAQMIAPNLPGIQAARSREAVAAQQGDSKLRLQEMKGQVQREVAQLKAQGVSDANIVKMMLGTAVEEGKQERFVEGEKGKTERAKIGADAVKSAAGTRASTKEDPAEKELRTSTNALAAIVSKPDYYKDAAAMAEFQRLTARIGELQRTVGRAGPSTPGPLAGPRAPGASSGPGTPQPKGKIRVKLANGKVGSIDPAQFDPKTMQKL